MSKITVKGQAATFYNGLPEPVKQYVTRSIVGLAPCAGQQMIVVGLTCDGGNDHIWRAFKLYAYQPGIRAIFHRDMTTGNISIEFMNWRDCDPYSDGR